MRKDRESPAGQWGEYREYLPHRRHLYLYERRYRGERLLIACAFSEKAQTWQLPGGYAEAGAELLLCNYETGARLGRLRPYEAQVWRWIDASASSE